MPRILIILCIFVLSGCGGGETQPAPEIPTPKINGFWQGSVTVNSKTHQLKIYIANDLVYIIGNAEPYTNFFAVGANNTALKVFTIHKKKPRHIWPSDTLPWNTATVHSPFLTKETYTPEITVDLNVNNAGLLRGVYSYKTNTSNITSTTIILDSWSEAGHPANIDGLYEISFSYYIRFDIDSYPTDYQNYIINLSVSSGTPTFQVTTQDDGFYLDPYETSYLYNNPALNFNNGCIVSFSDAGTDYSGFCFSDADYLYFIVKTSTDKYRLYRF